jgi:hypothetical protein
VALYRNVSGVDRFVDAGGRLVLVEDGAVVDIDDTNRYIQTGAEGEEALFERVASKKPTNPEKGE